MSYLRLQAAWKRADRLQILRVSEPRKMPLFSKPSGRFGPVWRSVPMFLLSLSLVAIIGYRGLLTTQPVVIADEQFSTSVGERQVVSLADGSQLTLNTNTSIHSKLTKNQRRVWLDRGEVYFDVAHDASRPFIIMAGDQQVTVLGTRFSVRMNNDDVHVSVSSGRVEVVPNVSRPDSDINAEVVRDNDEIDINGDTVIRSTKTAQQMRQAMAWQQGRLIADHLSLGEIAAQFNRYNRKQLIVDPSVAELQVACNFEVKNLDEFPEMLREGMELKINVKDERVQIGL